MPLIIFSKHDISWEQCAGLIADGAGSVSGCKMGLFGQMKP